MKKVNVSTKQMDKFAGKWVAIDPAKKRIIVVGDTLKEISSFVSYSLPDKRPKNARGYAFKVPRKDEGPYILLCPKIS